MWICDSEWLVLLIAGRLGVMKVVAVVVGAQVVVDKVGISLVVVVMILVVEVVTW